MRAALLLLALAACGGETTPPARSDGPTSAVSPTSAEARPAGPDDVIVASIDGHPVYGSCVAAQAAGHGLDARAALDQCLAFELLAQEAERRGLRADLDVGEAWRRELVRAVIIADLGTLTSFEQLPPAFLASVKYDEQKTFFHRPEIRVAFYVRAEFPKKTKVPEGSPLDLAAKELADAIFAELGDAEGVLSTELVEVAERLAKQRGAPPPDRPKDPYEVPPEGSGVKTAIKEFRDAIYALPAIGRIHAPVRTKWGWDVILWNDTLPAADFTQQIFQADLRRYFVPWSDGIARGLGLTRSVDDELFKRLYGDADAAPTAQAEPR